MKILRRTASQTAALFLMLAVLAAVILYQKGYYEISFVKRPALEAILLEEITTQAETDKSLGYTDEYTSPTHSDDNLSSITSPDAIKGEETASLPKDEPKPISAYDNLFSTMPSYASLLSEGWKLTDNLYDKTLHKIAKMSIAASVPNAFSLREDKTITRIWDSKLREYKLNTLTPPRPVIKLYMGYIFMDDGNTLSLLDDNGNVIMVNFDNIMFANERDEYDRPLFIYKDAYFYINEKNDMIQSGYKPLFGPPLKYDSLIGYNAPYQNLYLYYEEQTVSYIANQVEINRKFYLHGIEVEPVYAEETVKLWGYVFPNGEIAIPAQYYFAYNFGANGLAVVADRDKVASLITRSGSTSINPHGQVLYLKERNRRPSILGYYLPDTDSSAEIGMFYFDHGLIRMRRQLIDYYERDMVVSDDDVLITQSGALFDIPKGYKLVSYSNGILLLEKDGRYGCLDYRGRWIAQPIYTYALPFAEGLCAIGFKDGKKGMIDVSGNIVLPFVFDYVSAPSSGRIAVYETSHGWNVLTKLGS